MDGGPEVRAPEDDGQPQGEDQARGRDREEDCRAQARGREAPGGGDVVPAAEGVRGAAVRGS